MIAYHVPIFTEAHRQNRYADLHLDDRIGFQENQVSAPCKKKKNMDQKKQQLHKINLENKQSVDFVVTSQMEDFHHACFRQLLN